MPPASTQTESINRRILLASRPHGVPIPDNFRLDHTNVPMPKDGEVLLRTVYLSLDPYMRGRMSDAPSYAPPVEIEQVMIGGAVSRVVRSFHPDYRLGDWVLGTTGWQDYALSDGKGLQKLPADMAHPSYALGVLGMPGLTAYAGLLDIGKPQPGETVVVAAGTGAVGSLVGQIAKLKGCKVVGVAGGETKCRHAVNQLGFDACVDHRRADFPAQLAAACDQGVDIYFENVGGAVLDAVTPLLNLHARVPLCGLISQYNAGRRSGDNDRLPNLLRTALARRVLIQGFIIYDYYPTHFDMFKREMSAWLESGQIIYREDMIPGLEAAPEAFIGMMQGANLGKVIVQVGNH